MPSTVSVILPTFNRAGFLPEAFASIRAQTWSDWELIVVDDGSTDGTRELVERSRTEFHQPVRYIYQENAGAYAARNTGLRHATGEYIAFFDSDDLWHADYLKRCATAAFAHPELDWVYVACRTIELSTGKVLTPSTFYVGGTPRSFLALKTTRDGDLRILTDPGAVACSIRGGLYCGFQNSLIHRRVFARHDPPIFPAQVGEDVMTSIRAIVGGSRFGYIDEPLVLYRVHEENLSAASSTSSLSKRRASNESFAEAQVALSEELKDHPQVRRLLRHAASENYFWRLGYSVLWQGGLRDDALLAYRRAIALWPWNLLYWKTYLLAVIRTTLGIGLRQGSGPA